MQATLLGQFTGHVGNTATFNTPITTFNDKVYVSYVDPQERTVISQRSGTAWRTTVVEQDTSIDLWHTQPSIAVDPYGYVWATYNMHSCPWRIRRSDRPEDITAMTFVGQDGGTKPGGSIPDKCGCTGQCAEDWLSPGLAVIPGNHITYQHLATDRHGNLYICYRESLYQTADYHTRQWSGAISRYNANTKEWVRVARLSDVHKVPPGLQMYFDRSNRLHVTGVWGNHYTQAEGSDPFFKEPNYPFYLFSDDGVTFQRADGRYLVSPMNFSQFDQIVSPDWVDPHTNGYFTGTKITADSSGQPYVLVEPGTTTPQQVNRAFIRWDGQAWTYPPVLLPYAATRLHAHPDGSLIAVSSGLRVHQSKDGGTTWTTHELDLANGPCMPWVDVQHLEQTGVVRLLAFKNSAPYTLKVWDVRF